MRRRKIVENSLDRRRCYRKTYFGTGLMFDRLVGNISKKDGLQKKEVEKK